MKDQRDRRNSLLQNKSISDRHRPAGMAFFAFVLAAALCMTAGFGAVRAQARTADGTVRTRVIRTKNEDEFAKETSKLAKKNQGLSVMGTGDPRPYSSCRLIVRVKDGRSADLTVYNAETLVESNYGVSILQFSSMDAARKAAKKISALSAVSYVEPDDSTMNLGDTQITEIETGGSGGDMSGSSLYEGSADPFGYGDEDMTYASSVSASAAGVSTSRMSWGASYIQADQYAAYVKKNTKKTIKVAVVDSGVSSHTMLRGRLLSGKDFVDNDNDPTDRNGHGTHVAGIVVDCTPGLNVKILPVRVMNASGVGNPSVVGNGIRYAVKKGAKVINLSLGGYSHYKYLEECISYANRKGVTVVVAAGNGSDNTRRVCPAHLSAPIVVTAINKNGRRAYFSNYGKSVDISAPGVGIRSSWKNGGYATADGTSMAAPHISAVAAMYRLMHPSYNPSKIEKLVKNYAKDLGSKGNDSYYGRGVPRMAAAIPAAKKKKTKKKASIDLERPFALSGQLAPAYETGAPLSAGAPGPSLSDAQTGGDTGGNRIEQDTVVRPQGDEAAREAKLTKEESTKGESAGALDDNAQADFLASGNDVRKVYIYPCSLPDNAVIRDGSIVAGDRLALDVEIVPAPEGKYSLLWESSDPSVAAVDADGVVQAKAVGSTEITVSLSGKGEGGDTLSGSGRFTVKVLSPSVLTGDAAYSAGMEDDEIDLRAVVRLPGSLGVDEEEEELAGGSVRTMEAHTGPINEPAKYVLAVLREQGKPILLGAVDLEPDNMGTVHAHDSGKNGSSRDASDPSDDSGMLADPSRGKQTSDPGVLRMRDSSPDGGKAELSLSLKTGPLRALAASEASSGHHEKKDKKDKSDTVTKTVFWKCRLVIYRADAFEKREHAAADGGEDLVRQIDEEAVCSCSFTLKLEVRQGKAAEETESAAPETEKDAVPADAPGENPAETPSESGTGSDGTDPSEERDRSDKAESSDGSNQSDKAESSDSANQSDKAESSDGAKTLDTDPAASGDGQNGKDENNGAGSTTGTTGEAGQQDQAGSGDSSGKDAEKDSEINEEAVGSESNPGKDSGKDAEKNAADAVKETENSSEGVSVQTFSGEDSGTPKEKTEDASEEKTEQKAGEKTDQKTEQKTE